MQTLAPFKRGDVFQIGATAKDSAGVVINLTAVTIRSQVRTAAGALVAELLVSKANQTTDGFVKVLADALLLAFGNFEDLPFEPMAR